MEQDKREGQGDLYYLADLDDHVTVLKDQGRFNDKRVHTFPVDNRDRIKGLIDQLMEAPDSRHRLRIARQIESTVKAA